MNIAYVTDGAEALEDLRQKTIHIRNHLHFVMVVKVSLVDEKRPRTKVELVGAEIMSSPSRRG